ncbi:mitochondrial inner-membrane-bound regulator-domain-containing protein [Dichotomopilus funicola]|uniref:Mitochondrial inner-membrane-bound regulator-domain-containing protein n=1 Tax=Dichotomopilus funicola TaxID=1934379 RepID=A0AAN6V5Q6_9PEZI|nr:mitochondrial inner-membrane-bound regulator-domain-containing protein [Dichotomopilus funicola]
MLGRRVAGSAGFVCLRCRLQLARPSKRPSLGLNASPDSRENLSGDHQYDNLSHDAELDGSEIPFQDDAGNTEAPSTTNVDGHSGIDNNTPEAPGPESPASPPIPPPLPRRYFSRGHFVAPEQEGLSVETLGKPGSVIVLREKGVASARGMPEPEEEDDPANAVDPAKLLGSREAAEAFDDILLNIHELKPEGAPTLTDFEFNRLCRNITDGFTNAQLSQYLKEYQSIKKLSGEEDPVPDLPPWILEREPWIPIVEPALQEPDPRLDGYVTKRMKSKTRLAIRILRQCWDVSNQRVLEKDGYMSIHLSDLDFGLVAFGNRKWLESLPEAILNHVKEIKFIRETRTICIIGPKPAAESISSRVDDVLSKTQTADFNVEDISPKFLDSRVLTELGSLTNSALRLDKSSKKLEVTWMDFEGKAEILENPGETAIRLLHNAQKDDARAAASLVHITPEDETQDTQNGRYLPIFSQAGKLPWHKRFSRWERWVAPVLHSKPFLPPKNLPISLPFDLDQESGRVDTAKPPSMPGQATGGDLNVVESPPGWSPQPHTDTRAVFGYVVFARPQQDTTPAGPAQAPNPPEQPDEMLPRTFLPVLPALGSLNLPNNLHELGLWHTTTVIRFAPSPDLSPELAASAPALEVHVEADHREVQSIIAVRAVKSTFTSDALFPTAAVDCRFIQQHYYSLPGSSISDYTPSIVTFLQKSHLRPWAGEINTPPVLLGVELPHHVVPSSSSPSSSTTTPNTDSHPDTNTNSDSDSDPDTPPPFPVKLDYVLSSTEIRRTVTAEHRNLKLRYTSIDAHRHGGEWAELSLDAVRVVAPSDPKQNKFASRGGSGASSSSIDDAYALVDDADSYKDLEDDGSFHKAAVRPHALGLDAEFMAKPLEWEEYMRAVRDIVGEQGRLKWHAKRS